MPHEEPVATVVRDEDGNLVLNDPVALDVARAVAKHNCRHTLTLNADRVAHFERRIVERGTSGKEVVIVVLSVDDGNGGALAEILMPNAGPDWQAMRERGQVPFANGLVHRPGFAESLKMLDQDAAAKLEAIGDATAIVVMDHGVVEVFSTDEARAVVEETRTRAAR